MILDDIVLKKNKDLKNMKDIEQTNFSPVPSFYNAISKQGLSIIGEIKKASPSKGIIKEDFNPVELAKQYETCVDAISVLTEEHFFKGKNEYLINVHDSVNLPILRKDFIIDSKQIKEARNIGSSAVLLIVAILEPKHIESFIKLATELQMDCLVEVHTKEEVKIALDSGAKIIGINNRDLKTFKTDLNTTLELRQLISKDILVVSESGIDTTDDIKLLKSANINGILVGESFMRTNNIQQKALEFRNAYD